MTDRSAAGPSALRRAGPGAATALACIALFTLWPLLNFASQNREQVDAAAAAFLASMLAMGVLLGWTAFAALRALLPGTTPVGATAAVVAFVLVFMNYPLLYAGIADLFATLGIARGENPTYLAVLVLIPILLLWKARRPWILEGLLVFGILANLIPFGLVASQAFSLVTKRAAEPAEDEAPIGFAARRPSVFHFVTDAYARADVLEQRLDFDNGDFLDALRTRGFYVAERAYANYPTTFLSLAATVTMSYPITQGAPPFSGRAAFYGAIRGDNAVVRHFRRNGYRFAYQGSAVWDGSRCVGHEDRCLSSGRAFQQAVLAMTPLSRLMRANRPSMVADLDSALPALLSDDAPVYLFSHTMSPHPPPTFSSGCEERLRSGVGGADSAGLKFWGNKSAYLVDLRCVNEQLIRAIDAILERDEAAVIVIHGDHGVAFDVDWDLPIESWPRSQVEERFAIMLAIRLPEHCRGRAYPTLSPVNIYRLVLGCLSGAAVALLPDVAYVSPYERHPAYGTAFEVNRESEIPR